MTSYVIESANPFVREWLLQRAARRHRNLFRAAAVGAPILLGAALWPAGSTIQPLIAPVCVALFALLFCETARFSQAMLDGWRTGWLGAVPSFDARTVTALWLILTARMALRLLYTWITVLLLMARSVGAFEDLLALGYGLSLAIAGSVLGRWAIPGRRHRGIGVLRVSRLTLHAPGRVWTWQATTAATAWRTPMSAAWCAAILVSIPSGMPMAVTLAAMLAAFAFGASVAAVRQSVAVLPRAAVFLSRPLDAGLIRQGVAIPILALLGGGLTAAMCALGIDRL